MGIRVGDGLVAGSGAGVLAGVRVGAAIVEAGEEFSIGDRQAVRKNKGTIKIIEHRLNRFLRNKLFFFVKIRKLCDTRVPSYRQFYGTCSNARCSRNCL